MAPRLVSCPSCRVLVKAGDAECPRCGAVAPRTTNAPRLGAIALGLALVSCSGGDDGDTLGGPTSSSAGGTASEASTAGSATVGNSATSNASATATASSTGDDSADTNVPTTAQPPYGVPDTDDGFPGDDTTGTSGTGGETDSGDTGIKLDLE